MTSNKKFTEFELNILMKALLRFKRLADSLDCACDPAYEYECPIHKDRELAKMALEIVSQDDNGGDEP